MILVNVELNEQQQQLRQSIEENLEIVNQAIHGRPHENHDEAFRKMAEAAHELHMSLTPHPKHRGYMIENRELEADHPEFYAHVHPVEDLLAYLDDTSANDDPVDSTLGAEFYMDIYSRRWSGKDRYTLIRNADGWHVSHLSYEGQAGKNALEVLEPSLMHDSISYPRNLGSVIEDVWEQAADSGLSHEEVQNMLTEVAEWINAAEQNYPGFVR